MITILILGGSGATGRLLTKHLLAQTDHKIVIAGRNLNKAQAFMDSLHHPRVTAERVDATDPASLRRALQGVDLLLVAAPTTHHTETVVRTALDAGVDYLDVQYGDAKLGALRAHEREIHEKKLCFVTEAGYHPGLPSAMIRYAASKLDCIESARVAGYLNMGKLEYTEAVDELMEGFVHYQAQIFKNGAWTKPSSWDMRKFDFGDELGIRTCYSLFFEELRCIPDMYPTLRDTGFYISGSNLLADLILTPIIMVGLKIAPKRGIRPLGKLMWWVMGQSKPPYRVVLKVEAIGELSGKQVKPDFLDMQVDEIHLEMASREFSELEIIEEIAEVKEVAVGIVDVKSYYIETPDDIASRVRRCLKYSPPERLSFAPDCGLSQTARWAARLKLQNMVKGVKMVRQELGLPDSTSPDV